MGAFAWLLRQVGVMYGNPETTSGGNALKYYSSVSWCGARAVASRALVMGSCHARWLDATAAALGLVGLVRLQVRIDLRKKEAIKSGEEATGIRVKAKVVKNKTAPPLRCGSAGASVDCRAACPAPPDARPAPCDAPSPSLARAHTCREAMFDILFSSGIDTVGSIVDAAEVVGVVARRGSWYYWGERRLGQVRRTLEALVRPLASGTPRASRAQRSSPTPLPSRCLAQGRDKVVEALRVDPALLKELSDATQEALSATPEALLGLADELGEGLEEGPGLPIGAADADAE